MRSIFAGIYFRTFAVIAVVAAGIVIEPLGRFVIMLIDKIYAETFHFGPQVVKSIPVGRRTRRAYDKNPGALFA